MKKTIALSMALILMLALAACTTGTPDASSPTLAETAAATEGIAAITPTPTAEAAAPTSGDDTGLATAPTPMPAMVISSDGIIDGVIGDVYGARGTQKDGAVPTYSLPISVQFIPEDAKGLAVKMIDVDANDWAHWLALNMPLTNISANYSLDGAADMLQGRNDFGTIGYGGPTPPTGTHSYVITVYALDAIIYLDEGYDLIMFEEAIEGHVLASATIEGAYAA